METQLIARTPVCCSPTCNQTCRRCKQSPESFFKKLGLSQTSKRYVGAFTLADASYRVWLIRGNATNEMRDVYALWYSIYVNQLHYAYQHEDPNHHTDHANSLLVDREPNSWVFVVEHQGQYIGSLKFTSSHFSTLSADFQQLLPHKTLYEAGKFMVLPQYRNPLLNAALFVFAHQYFEKSNTKPDWLVCNAKEKLARYYTNFCFQKLSETPIISPLGNTSYLLGCDVKTFGAFIAMQLPLLQANLQLA